MRGLIVIFLLFISIIAFIGPAQSQRYPFRNDYTYDIQTRYFYKEGPKAKAWRGAVFDCEGEGAELAIPFNQAEFQGIVRHMSADTASVWLGIHDPSASGKFRMANGSITALTFETSGPIKKSCVGMLKNGNYSAYNCDTPRKFVCVKDAATVTSNADCKTYDMGYVYSVEAERCYKVHTQPRGWENARKLCNLEGNTLAVINSHFESEEVLKILKDHEANTGENHFWGDFNKEVIHLGYKNFMTNGEGFVTAEGSSLARAGFEVWAPGQPAAKGPGVQCGGMLRNGNLTVVDCHEKAIFICEQ